MVKKIRVIEDASAEEASPEQTMLEIAKSVDWKLWEMLQVLQRLEKKVALFEPENDDDEE